MIFTVTLRNTPVYSGETLRWLMQFDPLDLSGNQKRLLAYAKEHDGTFTSRAYQSLAGLDLYMASQDIKDLIRKGVVRLRNKGGRVYELVTPGEVSHVEIPEELARLAPMLRAQRYLKNQDIRQALEVSESVARRVANRLVALGWLRPEGDKRGRRYLLTKVI